MIESRIHINRSKHALRAIQAPGLATSLALMLALTGCPTPDDDDVETPTPTPTPTATPAAGEFISALAYGGSRGGEEDAPSEDGSDDDGGGEEREVQEADIFVQEGHLLYLLNMYRGVQIIDVTDPDHPTLRGRVPLAGYPIEMYVEDSRAYVVVSDYFSYWRVSDAETDADVDSFYGSTLAVLDVHNPDKPSLMGQIDLEGYVSQTRRVGDVIYAVSNRYSYYTCGGTTDDVENTLNLISIDISDPADPHAVAQLGWPGSSAQVYATPDTFYVIEPDYEEVPPNGEPVDGTPSTEPDPEGPPPVDPTPRADGTPDTDPVPPDEPVTYAYLTHLTAVDISDPHGDLKERDTIDIPGTTWDKFALDEYDQVLRIVTQKWDGISSGTLTTVDVSDLHSLTQLASIDLILPLLESVTATRFDGDRGYIVTAERVDPLFVVDLRDPQHPILGGQVEMPGQITHIETRGNRLIALGQDNADSGTWRFAVSLFDVEDLNNPSLLDRVTIGDGQYSWSQATWDEKAFSVIDSEGLIAVPFTAYSYVESNENDEGSYYTYTMTGGVQLVDFDDADLTLRGMVTHPGYVTRVRPVGERLASMSDTHLLMMDIEDRDAPKVTADITLARNVVDYLPIGDFGVQLGLPDWYGDTGGALRIVSNDTPDEMDDAMGEASLDLSDGQLFPISSTRIGLIRSGYDYSTYAYESTLDVYDVSHPTTPIRTASLALPAPVWSYMDNYSTFYGSSGGTLVQGDHYVAFLEANYYYNATPEVDEEGDPTPKPDGTPTPKPSDMPLSFLHVIDLTDPDAPALVSLPFDQSLFGLKAQGAQLYATHAEQIGDTSTARYYADIFDLSNPSAPVQSASINIPGTLLRTLEGGNVLVTLDTQWDTRYSNGYAYYYVTYSLRTVRLENGKAIALDEIPLDGYTYSLNFSADMAYIMLQRYTWYTTDGCYQSYPVQLQTLSLQDPSNLETSDIQTLPVSYGYARALVGGRLFVDAGSGGLLVYDVEADPEHPLYQTFARTSGWVMHVRVQSTSEGSKAYFSSGMYGVTSLDL